jgi:DNA-binding response OmpR family regulator
MNGKDKPKSGASPGTTLQGKNNLPRRILVVDDEPDIRKLYTDVLIDSGYHVDAVEDGDVAWDNLQTKNYDLLITDNEMPNVSGVELIKKLQRAEIKLPVIMATGTWPEHEFNQNPGLQPKVKLLKPWSISDLLSAVGAVLCPAHGVRDLT